ncbi:MAG: leucine-rich repeat domain-containing protein [Coriobacteriia bacterium]|nr:leucine-rich repeat domain-containing protein [Coriobacteriia bacterium]
MSNRITVASRFVSCACAAALALSVPGAGLAPQAFAVNDGGDGIVVQSAGTVSCANGWVLSYGEVNGKACITGVVTEGSGTLEVPAQAGGLPVRIIGKAAFKDCRTLDEVTLPEGLELFQSEAFCGSSVRKVSIPASAKAVSYRCFKNCDKLTEVTFQGSTMLYLAQEAFMYCTALEYIEVPYLSSYPVAKSTADDDDSPRTELFADTCSVGKSCFAQCSSLETVVFNGVVEHKTPKYFLDISCFNGCSKLRTFTWFCKKDTASAGTSWNKQLKIENNYYTLDFYGSREDADGLQNRQARLTYRPKAGDDDPVVNIYDLIYKKQDYAEHKLPTCTDQVPDLPDGKVWGVADQVMKSTKKYISDSYQVIAVDRDDMDYGWLASDETSEFYDAYEDSLWKSGMSGSSTPTLYFEADGTIADLATMKAYAADGSELDPSTYEVVYEQYVVETGSSTSDDKYWHEVQKASEPGQFRAYGRSKVNGTKTPLLYFTAAVFSPKVQTYDYTHTNMLGAFSSDAANLMKGTVPAYNVVVPCSDWRAQLIGASLAGLGNGLLMFDDASTSPSSDAYRAQVLSKSDSVQFVGSTRLLPQSVDTSKNAYLSDWLVNGAKGDRTRYKDDVTPQALAAQVHSVMAKGTWGVTWGDTAVVVSSAKPYNALLATQLLYGEKAPVFFADASGKIYSSELSRLMSGKFARILAVGDSSCVSDEALSAVTTLTGVTPERVLADAGSACDVSLAQAEALVQKQGKLKSVSVVDGTVSANVVQGGQLAALGEGAVLVCNSSRDVKKVQEFLYELVKTRGITSVGTVNMVGDFAHIDAKAAERIRSVWGAPLSTEAVVGDTIESDGLICKVTGADTAQLVGLTEFAGSSVSVNSVRYDGKSYKVTSVAAGALDSRVKSVTLGANVKALDGKAFAQCSNLTTLNGKGSAVTTVPASALSGKKKLSSVSFGKVTSVGSNAFKGCTALKTVSLGSSLKTVGSSAFAGCTSLAKFTAGSKLTTVGTSAFSGCKKLATVSLGSAVKTVGSKAFYGCAALSSASWGSALTSVGSYAFYGCAKLKSATMGSKLASIGTKAFYGCKSCKTLTVKSTKLSSSKVGSKAFSGMPSKPTVKVPKSKMKAYKSLFVKKGLSKKAVFKKC